VNTGPPCDNWLAIVADDDVAAALESALRGSAREVRQVKAGTQLVHCNTWSAPRAIIMDLSSCAAAPEWPAEWDVPLVMVGSAPDLRPEDMQARLVGSGAHHWLPHGEAAAPADWALALAFAQAAHRRDQAQRHRIASLQDQLAERRVVARAKGLLMAAQGMTEEDAFALLRSGAMQTRSALADMARAVVDAAIWSEAVNRAGQLRWLSQRCIAAAAQRLARIDPPAARRMQNDALKRAREILDDLARLALPEPVRQRLDETDGAWRALKARLDDRLDLGSLQLADAAADQALAHAEALAGSLQAVGSSPILRVINLCGRQRMRAQRLVKLGLLARLGLTAGEADEVSGLVTSFDATMQEMTNLPLGSSEIRDAHQLAADRWRDMARVLQAQEAAALVHGGEALLVSVDDLTRCWERSLQLLLD
jgi:hypothetical protein